MKAIFLSITLITFFAASSTALFGIDTQRQTLLAGAFVNAQSRAVATTDSKNLKPDFKHCKNKEPKNNLKVGKKPNHKKNGTGFNSPANRKNR